MNKLEEWSHPFRNKSVRILEGPHIGAIGKIKKLVGYNNSLGAIAAVKLYGVAEPKHFTPNQFEFVNPLTQEEWDKDD